MYLGQRLVQAKLLTIEQVQIALQAQVVHGGRIGTNLLRQGFLDVDALSTVLSEHYGVPAARLKHFDQVERAALACVPSAIAEKYSAVPLALSTRTKELIVAFRDPRDLAAIDEIAFIAGARVRPFVAPEVCILRYLERLYSDAPNLPAPEGRRKQVLPAPALVRTAESLEEASAAIDQAEEPIPLTQPKAKRAATPFPMPGRPSGRRPREIRETRSLAPKPSGGEDGGPISITRGQPEGSGVRVMPARSVTPGAARLAGLSVMPGVPTSQPPPPPPKPERIEASLVDSEPSEPAGALPERPSPTLELVPAFSFLEVPKSSLPHTTPWDLSGLDGRAVVEAQPLPPPAAPAPLTPPPAPAEPQPAPLPPMPPPEAIVAPPAAAPVALALATPPEPEPILLTEISRDLRPALSLDDAIAQIASADSKDGIGQAIVDYLRSTYGCGLILIVRDGVGLGWTGFAPGIDEEVIASITVPLSMPSVFQLAYERKTLFRGAPTVDESAGVQARFFKLLKSEPPREVITVPIVLNRRVVNLLYVQALEGAELHESASAELTQLTKAASSAFLRLIKLAKSKSS